MKRGGYLKRVGFKQRVPGTARVEEKAVRAPKPSQVLLKCKNCGQSFYTWPYRVREGVKACSPRCAGMLKRTRVTRACQNCGSTFTTSLSQFKHYKGAGKYCSRRCSYQGMVAATALKPINDKYGRSNRTDDKKWRIAVRDKDQNTCQRCGVVQKYIHTHHVAPRSRRPDLRHDISNGKCLCNSCHSWVHEHPIEATALGLLSGDSYELARKKLKGEEHGCAKLTEANVIAIRQRYAAGERSVVLANEFDVGREHIHSVVVRRVWKHI